MQKLELKNHKHGFIIIGSKSALISKGSFWVPRDAFILIEIAKAEKY